MPAVRLRQPQFVSGRWAVYYVVESLLITDTRAWTAKAQGHTSVWSQAFRTPLKHSPTFPFYLFYLFICSLTLSIIKIINGPYAGKRGLPRWTQQSAFPRAARGLERAFLCSVRSWTDSFIQRMPTLEVKRENPDRFVAGSSQPEDFASQFLELMLGFYLFLFFLQQNGVNSARQPPILTSKERHSASQRPSILWHCISLCIPPRAEWRKQGFSYPDIGDRKATWHLPGQIHNSPVPSLLQTQSARLDIRKSTGHLSSGVGAWTPRTTDTESLPGIQFPLPRSFLGYQQSSSSWEGGSILSNSNKQSFPICDFFHVSKLLVSAI